MAVTLRGTKGSALTWDELDANFSGTGTIAFSAKDLTLTEEAAPSTPATGYVAVYAKTDGLVYSKDDAGTESLLSRPATGRLGYATATTNQTGITTEVDVTSLSTTVAILTGQIIKVTVQIYNIESTVLTDDIDIVIKEGATVFQYSRSVGKGHATAIAWISPSAGNHTYKATVQRAAGTGTLTLQAGATYPAFISVELV
jgi:hypothetical protein